MPRGKKIEIRKAGEVAGPSIVTPSVRLNISDAERDRLIGDIYDAALDPSLWPKFLAGYSNAIGAHCATTLARNMRTDEFYYMEAAKVDPSALESYVEYYSAIEPWIHEPRILPPSGSVCTSPMLVEDTKLEASEYYTDFLTPIDIRHICALVTINEKSAFSSTSAFRARNKHDFGDKERAFALVLWPHLKRAFEINQRLAQAEIRTASFQALIDQLPCAVFFISPAKTILYFNKQADRLLDSADGLQVKTSGVEISLPGEQRRLDELIDKATTGSGAGGLIRISRPSGKQAYQILVTPIRVPSEYESLDTSTVALFVTDPERQPRLPNQALISLYGLTQSEARFASLMATGASLDACAEVAGLTRETGRTYLKRIFSKTGTSRQGELVQVLLGIPNFGKHS